MTSYNTGATNSSDTSATVTLAIPAGVNVGDVMVMSLTCFNENATTPTIAFSGAGGAWTLVPVSAGINPEISSGSGIFQYGFAYYRVATAGDQGATLTITGSGSGFSSATTWWAVAMAAYTGASVAAPVDVAGGVNNIGDQDVYTITTRSLTTGVSGDWAVYLFPGGPGVGTTLGGPGTIRKTIVSDAGIGSVISDSNGSVGAAGTSIGGGNFTVAGNSGGVWLTAFTIGLAPASGVTSTGNLMMAAMTMAGTGAGGNNTSSGSLKLSPLKMAGTAVVHIVCSGGLALAPLRMAGTGAEAFASTGSLALSPLKMAGQGAGGNNTSSGGLALAPLRMAGTAAETFSSTGSLALSPLKMAGQGAGGNNTLTGSLALSPMKMHGAGSNGKTSVQVSSVDDYRHRMRKRWRRRMGG